MVLRLNCEMNKISERKFEKLWDVDIYGEGDVYYK